MTGGHQHMVRIKRVYSEPDDADGFRVLVDRLWPRGLSRDNAHIDLWMKEVAPSDDLRKWFGHRKERWPAFRDAYRQELDSQRDRLEELRARCAQGIVTLLFAARDEDHNNAVVIGQWLQDHAQRAGPESRAGSL